jgi:cephalosporin-C deacetylase
MAFFDLPLEELRAYRPERSEPADFDSFWQQTLAETRQYPLDARFEVQNQHAYLRSVQVLDVTFNGYSGQPIKGWLMLPAAFAIDTEEKLPCVVEYLGYGGGRSLPLAWLEIANAGYAHFVMDTRGQGSSWSPGDTPDLEPLGFPPQVPGFRTRGLPDRQRYYHRRLFIGAVRAVEAARAHPLVDPARLAVAGGSQGGGVALAAAGLEPGVRACLADVPSKCHIRRAIGIAGNNTTSAENVAYLRTHRSRVDEVLNTLDYFDGVNFAARAHAPALFSVGLMDPNCPPSTVFAAYNHYRGPKEMRVYEYNYHEGGETFQTVEKLKFLRQQF